MAATTPSAELLDRLPPSDVEAEKAVVGSLLLNPGRFPEVAAILRAGDFYAAAHRRVFGAMRAMVDEGLAVDGMLVADRLKQTGELEAVGGRAYLAEIAQSIPVAVHATYYARIVARKARYRAVIQAGMEMVRRGYGEEGDPDEVLDAAEQALAEVHTGQYDRAPVDAGSAATQAREHVYEMQAKQRAAGLPTGLSQFDERLGGLFPGELFILAARTGLGKTALGCQIAHHSASRGRLNGLPYSWHSGLNTCPVAMSTPR